MRRPQQTFVSAQQRGSRDDSPERSIGHHNMAPITVGVIAESRHRLRDFLIGIAVLFALLVGCFDLLVSTNGKNRSGNSEQSESQVQGERLPLCASKLLSSEWKSTLMKVSSTESTRQKTKFGRSSQVVDDSQTISIKSDQNVTEKSNRTTFDNKSSIRHNPRMIHDLARFNLAQHSDSSRSLKEYCSSFTPDAGLCVMESEKLGLRCLPSFLIVGTLNSGGNHLMNWLNKHPNLQSGKLKFNITLLFFYLFVYLIN